MIKRRDYPKTTLEEAIQYFEALAATSDFYRQVAAWLYELKERRDVEKGEKMTQKQLIDYCNNAPWGHCSICPYDSKECKIYCTKYGTPPVGENYNNSERYTDEEILINKNTVENCCKNCQYSGNYDGWNEFICKYYNGMIRGEQYDCEGFEPERRTE